MALTRTSPDILNREKEFLGVFNGIPKNKMTTLIKMKALCYHAQPAEELEQPDTPRHHATGLLSKLRIRLAVQFLFIAYLTAPVWGQIGTGKENNVVLTLPPPQQVLVTNANAISLGNNAQITLNNGVIVQTTTTQSDSGKGNYGKGWNTIEFNNNSTITIQAGAQVIAAGVGRSSEAINPIGAGNTITNFGLIKGEPSSAIFFENINTNASSPRNTVDNFGTIQAIPTGSNPGLTGEAIGSFGNVGINFINEAGAQVIGNLDFQGGNDNVTLFPGSKITGNFDGGGGFNTLTLNGAAGTSDSFSGEVKNFQTLTKTGPGSWTLTGSIGDNGGNDPLTVLVDSGILNLTGNNANFNGSIIVNPGPNLSTPGPNPLATLAAAAQSLPPLITDHGIVVFNQMEDGTYSGLIQGTGEVVKNGVGTLTLVGANTYSGGTFLNQGTVAIAADNILGAVTGGLFFSGGTLRFDSDFDLAPTRAITLLGGGGTIDTNGHTTTISQPIVGVGSLTTEDSTGTTGLRSLIGSTGTLILTGTNTYQGGTTIASGTLQLGNGGTTGSVAGNITDNGVLVIDHSDSFSLPATISGSGRLTQAGTGTTILTGDNSYSGSTLLANGALTVGNNPGSIGAAQGITTALGNGSVFVINGTLQTPSAQTGIPLAISVGSNYVQSPRGTLSLGIGGIKTSQYDRIRAGGSAILSGTLDVDSLNGFRPSAFQGFLLVRTQNQVRGRFGQINDAFNTDPTLRRVDVYAPNGFALVYVKLPHPPGPQPTPEPPGPQPPGPQPPSPPDIVDPIPDPLPDPGPGQPLPPAELVPILDPTVNQLTSLFEISFSGANIQRLNFAQRMDEIQNGSTGFSSNVTPVTSPTEGKGIADGKSQKSVVQPQPVLLPVHQDRWGVWVTGFGDFVSLDGNSLVQGYSFTTGGVMLGVDYRITDHFAIGVSGGYAHTWTQLQPAGNVGVNTGRGGIYATYFDRGFYVNAAAYGGYNSYNTSRQGLVGFATGNTDGEEFSTFVGGGYDWRLGHFAIGPLAYLQYTNVHINGFNESGSDFPLQIHSDTEESLRSDLGFRASFDWAIGHIYVVPFVYAAWEHEFDYSALPITASLGGVPGATGTFFGPAEGHDSAVVSTGVRVNWTPTISTYVSYDGQVGRFNYDSNAVSGGVSVSF